MGKVVGGGKDERRVDACGRQGGVAGKLVPDVSTVTAAEWPPDIFAVILAVKLQATNFCCNTSVLVDAAA